MLQAGSKALLKSVGLSVVVLGPGFALLLQGITIPGMIWLFCGSFGLMAWSYRKPWRLGAISCLIPPVAAALCYGLQLWLFGQDAPPALLLGAAILLGLAIGYWRARSHRVVAAPDGGVFAERTIGYLLVWVAAYAVTQGLGLLAAGTYTVRAGLVTGAFSTAMLIVVSVVIWRQLGANSRPAAMMAVFLFASLGVLGSSPAHAKVRACDQVANSWDSIISGSSLFRGLTDGSRNLYHAGDEQRCTIYKNYWRDMSDLRVARSLVVHVESVSNPPSQSEIARQRSGGSFDPSIRDHGGLIKWNNDGSDEKVELIFWKQGLRVRIGLDAEIGTVSRQQMESGVRQIQRTIYNRITGPQAAPAPAAPAAEPTRQAEEDAASDPASSSERGGLGAMANAGVVYDPQLDCLLDQRMGGDCEDSEAATAEPASEQPEPVAESEEGNTPGTDPEGDTEPAPPSDGLSSEQLAQFAAAIAAILIAAGVAINIAQAIAAALANAVQSTAQLTAEELEAAIAEGLAQTGEAQVDPIYHWNGEPYSTNEKGEYFAPDDDGTYRWMSKEDALKASARERENAAAYDEHQAAQKHAEAQAIADEKRRREDYERDRDQRFQKGAAQDMENSGTKMREQDNQQRGAEADAKAETAAANARQNQLYNGILNALVAMPGDQRVTALINELGTTYENGDTAGMNSLWGEVRGVRQSMLDESAQKAAEHERHGERMGQLESGATYIRDASKKTIAGAISASGPGGVVVGTLGLMAVGGTEGGVQAKGGSIKLDGYGAAQGGARGFKDSFNAVIGGLNTNGSRGRAALKVLAPSFADSMQKVADSFNKTGDWDKAKEDGMAEFASKTAQGATGEIFDEQDRLSQLRAGDKLKGTPDFQTLFEVSEERGHEAFVISAKKTAAAASLEFGSTMVVDGKTAREAFAKTVRSQTHGQIARRLTGAAKKDDNG